MYSTVLQCLEQTALKYPDKTVFADVKESFTFHDLLKLSQKIGSFIADLVSPQNPIVVYMDKRAYNLLSFMGAAYAGCFYVPIDSQMPSERINLILDTLQPSMILYDDATP